jgi:hypothetical protein
MKPLPKTTPTAQRNELIVLSLIAGGLLAVLILIICGLFGWFESKAQAPLPNWAENVLISIATAATLKLGDCLAALVTLAAGRQVETLGAQLATSTPAKPLSLPAPPDAQAAADQVADAAVDAADGIKEGT